MILRLIVGIIKAAVNAVIKLIAWLLIAVGLWMPAIFSVIFFIVCAVTKTPFASVNKAFFMGLVITTVLSIWHTLASGKKKSVKKKKHKSSATYLSKIKEKENRVELTKVPPNGSVFRGGHEPDDQPDQADQPPRPPKKRNYSDLKKEHYQEMQQRYGKSFEDAASRNQNDAKYQNDRYQDDARYQNDRYQDDARYQNDRYQDDAKYQNDRYQDDAKYQNDRYQDDARYQNDRYQDPISGFAQYNGRQDPISGFAQYNGRQDPISGFAQYNGRQDPISGFAQYNERNDAISSFAQYNQNQEPLERFEHYDRAKDNVRHRGNAGDIDPPRPNESPRIFLSRRNEALLIYEYSDRLEYYIRTSRGLVYDSTKFKSR